MANSKIIGAGQDTACPAPKTILDVCCGGKAFWFNRMDDRVLFVDKRSGVFRLKRNDNPRSPVVVEPDTVASFANLPFISNCFRLVVLDPPHMKFGPSSNMAKTYGRLEPGWDSALRCAFTECFRVLVCGGILIFKWCEFEIPVSDVLALTDQRPLFGHKSGKQAKTHWITFMKAEDRTSCAPDSPAQDTMEICHTAPNSAMVPCQAANCSNIAEVYLCGNCFDSINNVVRLPQHQ